MRTTTCSGGCEGVAAALAARAARRAVTGEAGGTSSLDVAFRWSRASRAGCNATWTRKFHTGPGSDRHVLQEDGAPPEQSRILPGGVYANWTVTSICTGFSPLPKALTR